MFYSINGLIVCKQQNPNAVCGKAARKRNLHTSNYIIQCDNGVRSPNFSCELSQYSIETLILKVLLEYHALLIPKALRILPYEGYHKNDYYFIASHKWYKWHGFLADNKRWREKEMERKRKGEIQTMKIKLFCMKNEQNWRLNQITPRNTAEKHIKIL